MNEESGWNPAVLQGFLATENPQGGYFAPMSAGSYSSWTEAVYIPSLHNKSGEE